MLAVGIAASVDQRIAYLESTFLNGKKQQALEEWEKAYDPLDSTLLPEYAPEYLESGIRMYGLAGNPLRAHEIMHRLFMLYPIRDPDIMKAVFRAYTQSKKTEYHDVAIKIYREAKGRLDTGMTIKDYDCFFVGFLEAGNLIHAKEVYRDMVKDMELGSDPSHEAIEQVLRRLRMLYGLADDIVQTTKVALQAIAILPTAYHSHLFGDWMKLAVTRKAPAAMAQILDMMFTRGYQPETFHFNVLLRTLFRSNEKEYILKAENLGWQMMNEASQGVPTRRPFQSAVDAISRAQRPHPVPTEGPSLPRKVPPANATTIALLMWHHSRSTSGWEHVHYLSKQMETLRIPPNEEVMNVLMDHACRKGDYNKVWDIYHFLTNPANDSNGVFPNGATFRCLWTAMRLCLGDHTTREKSTLPTPRELLAEQIRWWDLVRRRPDSNSFKTGLAAADFGAIYKLIMHSFSAFKDLPGTLVAMHALRWKFGVLPSNNASQILQNQVAWVDAYGVSQEVRTQYAHSGVPGKIFAQMGQIYHILMDARFRRMNITGDDFARMSQKEVGDIDLNLLSEFVRVILKRQYSPGDVEAMIDQAKDDVGVPDMSTGDRDAFAVV
jgi:tetratricopeptide (TPR) repeat protein